VTDKDRVRSIRKHGISPKPNRRTKDGVRVVWLTDSLENAKRVAMMKRFSDRNPIERPVILKLNLNNIKVTLHSQWKDGFKELYCTKAIAPNRIIYSCVVT
jgi:hypothetical protein